MSDRLHTVLSGSSARRQWLVAAAWAGLAVAGTAFAQSAPPAPADPVATPPGNAAGNPATASATDAYTSFRTEFDAGRYAEAVPHAERVLELAAAQATTPTAEEVQVALMNLGMVQNLSDDYVGAESTYLRVIKLIESSGRPLHDRLARAYAGLASAYHDGNRHDLAVQSFDQAIALKRRHEGLLTAKQVPLVEKYIDSLTELGRYPEALKAQKYLLRIATRQYGGSSPQLAPTLEEIGRWYTSIGAYDQSRRTLRQAIEIVEAAEGPNSPLLVGPLLAIAACNRRQLLDPAAQPLASPDEQREALFHDPSAMLVPVQVSPASLAGEGERSLLRAAQIVDQAAAPSPVAVLNVRTQIGDWYQVRNQPDRARSHYQQAWRAAARVTDKLNGKSYTEAIFGQPVLLHLFRPDDWNRYPKRPPTEVEVRNVVVEYTVSALGRVEAPQVIDDSGDKRRGEKTALSLQSTARYRPRLENGEPVATPGVQFSQPWILLLPPPAEKPAAPATPQQGE
ncbi:MAG: tetratricopeptide repeat protein [Proteobacteria bacterium]|nr:tetratricopeptide repeat protein [Pseudomonadota bacterium]